LSALQFQTDWKKRNKCMAYLHGSVRHHSSYNIPTSETPVFLYI